MRSPPRVGARGLNWLGGITAVLMLASLWADFVYAPTEATQGDAQRIFYLHVPLAWVAYLAFAVVFVCSILYLWRRSMRWDVLARSSAEVGLVFTTLVLLTGSLWGRPIWGAWWAWDARMTTTLILWLIYAAYLMLRSYAGDDERGARYAAVLGIVGFADVPLVHRSVTWWRTLHPQPVVLAPASGPQLPGSMLATLLLSLLVFTLLYVYLLGQKMAIESAREQLRQLRLASLGQR